MNKPIRFILLLATMLFAAQALLAAEPVNYYKNAKGKSDEALMTALCNIIRNHKEVSYSSGLLNAFAIADVDDEGYIIDIYSNCRYRPSDNGSSASHVGEGYNREHSFPRSWFGGEVAPMNTDVFHVYPTDIRVNSQRGNHPYGVCDKGTRLTYGSYVVHEFDQVLTFHLEDNQLILEGRDKDDVATCYNTLGHIVAQASYVHQSHIGGR